MSLHIYAAPYQPVTRFRDDLCGGRPFVFRYRPRRAIWTDCCYRRRWACYCRAQVYYDGLRVWCRPGHECKKGRKP